MRKRCTNPPVPARIQHNVISVSVSSQVAEATGLPQLTSAEIISEAPLSKLALYIRQLTNGATQEALDQALEGVVYVRDRSSLALNCKFPLRCLERRGVLLGGCADSRFLPLQSSLSRPCTALRRTGATLRWHPPTLDLASLRCSGTSWPR